MNWLKKLFAKKQKTNNIIKGSVVYNAGYQPKVNPSDYPPGCQSSPSAADQSMDLLNPLNPISPLSYFNDHSSSSDHHSDHSHSHDFGGGDFGGGGSSDSWVDSGSSDSSFND